MTQFSLSSANDNHLAKSQQKTSHILDSSKMKSLGFSSKSFYGNSTSKTRVAVPYLLCSRAVRNEAKIDVTEGPYNLANASSEKTAAPWSSSGPRSGLLHVRSKRFGPGLSKLVSSKKLDVRHGTVAAVGIKSQSVPLHSGSKQQSTRTSLSSPPRKVRRLSSPRVHQDCRAKRILTYSQPEDSAEEPEADKENWDHAGEVDIHKILQTLDRDMEIDNQNSGETLEERVLGTISDTDEEEEDGQSKLTCLRHLVTGTEEPAPAQQQTLPQDMGFPNPPGSNRCWMNATLQAILGMEPFVEELEHSSLREERNGQLALVRSFFEVVKSRRRCRRSSLHMALRHLSRSLGSLDVMFASDRQQDATEFLVRLLDLFREQFSCSETVAGRKMKDSCTLRELQLDNLPTAPRFSTAGSGATPNPVCDNVEFRLRETYRCNSCNECSCKCQDHLALFLDIPPTTHARPSLQEALNRYMEPDVRELKCSKCDGQRSRVETSFVKLPRFLLVQVKRYAVQTAMAEKLTSSLRVPISLSVKNLVADDVAMPVQWLPSPRDEAMQTSLADEDDKDLQEAMRQSVDEEEDLEALELEKAIQLSLQEQRGSLPEHDCSVDTDVPVEGEDDSPELSYRLVCVVMHQGLSPNCGHYVADVYNLEQKQWYHYDDEVVTRPTEDEVVGSSRQRNGYVFCYMHRQLFDQLSSRNTADTSWGW